MCAWDGGGAAQGHHLRRRRALLLPFSGSRPRLLLPSRSPWSGSGGREGGEEGEEEVLKVEGARRP